MNSFKFVKPNWHAPANIRALTTTVFGGVSQGVYGSLNLGNHVSDDVDLVLENRAIIKARLSLPNEPVWLNQVHGAEVIELVNESKNSLEGSLINAADGSLKNTAKGVLKNKADGSSEIIADGSFTHVKGQVCAIMTADCMPLFLTTKLGDRVALLHVGWRGLANGIIESGVRALGCSAADIIAWAGPTIGPNAFEIGDEVRQKLGGSDQAYKASVNSSNMNIKWYANLYQLTAERLANIGVDKYTHSDVCTYTDESFFSFRRTGQCGRMVSLIWIDE